MTDKERPEITVPIFCEGCPAAWACGLGKIVVARAGQRTPINIGGAVYHLGGRSRRHFVVAYDINNTYAEPVLLGEGDYGDAEAIAQEAVTGIEGCEGSREVRSRFGLKREQVCGAGVVRFSERHRGLGYLDELTTEDLQNPGWINVLAPRALRDELSQQYWEKLKSYDPDSGDLRADDEIGRLMFGGTLKSMGPDVVYRSRYQAEQCIAEYRQKQRDACEHAVVPSDEDRARESERINRIFEEVGEDEFFNELTRRHLALPSIASKAINMAREWSGR